MTAPPSNVLAVRDAAIQAFKDAPELQGFDLRTIESHPGMWDRQELERYTMPTPAVLVSVLGGDEARHQGASAMEPVEFAAFIVVKGRDRDDLAVAISEQVASIVLDNRWGVGCTRRASRVRRSNLYSSNVGRKTIAMWSVSWSQDVEILTPKSADEFDDFNTAIANYVVHVEDADATNDPDDTFVSQTITDLPQE